MGGRQIDPRVEHTRRVVLQAAAEVVAERGFADASIDAIAQRSGVARSTIYRHWPDRMTLLLGAVRSLLPPPQVPTDGDARSILTALATQLSEMLAAEPLGSIVATLIAESHRDQRLNELREKLFGQRVVEVAEVLREALGREELPAGLQVATLVDDVSAPIFFHALAMRAPVDAAWIEGRVDQVLAAAGLA